MWKSWPICMSFLIHCNIFCHAFLYIPHLNMWKIFRWLIYEDFKDMTNSPTQLLPRPPRKLTHPENVFLVCPSHMFSILHEKFQLVRQTTHHHHDTIHPFNAALNQVSTADGIYSYVRKFSNTQHCCLMPSDALHLRSLLSSSSSSISIFWLINESWENSELMFGLSSLFCIMYTFFSLSLIHHHHHHHSSLTFQILGLAWSMRTRSGVGGGWIAVAMAWGGVGWVRKVSWTRWYIS